MKRRLIAILLFLAVLVVATDSASAYYSTNLGRFISRDPIGYDGGTNNLYEYVGGKPVNEFDPLGLASAACLRAIAHYTAVMANPFSSIVELNLAAARVSRECFSPPTPPKPTACIKCKNIVFKRRDIDLTADDKYGHWWVEIGSKESYGWWPFDGVGPCDTVCGVQGELNGDTNFGGTPTKDPHHGDIADKSFVGVLHPGKGCPATCAQAEQCIRNFAQGYTGIWCWPGGNNCHTFQEEMMEKCCLAEK